MLVDNVRIFVELARSKTFTEAARKLGMPKSTVSTRIRLLEDELATDLFKRTTRKVTLTEAGQRYFEVTERLLVELEAASETVRSSTEALTGTLRITAGVDAGAGLVGDIVAEFAIAHPELDVDFMLRGDVVDLVAEGVDVALRMSPLRDSTLKAKKLGTTSYRFVATPRYLAEHGTPRQPSDLSEHRVIRFSARMDQDSTLDLVGPAKPARVSLKRRIRTNSIAAVRHQALAGSGIGYLPFGACLAEVETGRLVAVLPKWGSSESPMCVVYPNQRFVPRKVRLFVDFLSRRFADVRFFERTDEALRRRG
ncbi:Transcriptional regulator, LysR family [Labilithrix luteola]|uniref:Transcriptional regulator, LysR family n=1 Tax=Labilithrix luteola TaxID=1391654 RepID=A0A0K1Q201_9BACT|nr:LysR family transcriptional regulator [Labilithrix luteola]AKU99747.1 Transcriptional regulator, LysR family [Labilithrix luteola]